MKRLLPPALAAVAVPLAQTLKRFEREGFAPFLDAFTRRDLLRGRAVSVSGGLALEGSAEGVDAQGALLVRAGGTCHRVVSANGAGGFAWGLARKRRWLRAERDGLAD